MGADMLLVMIGAKRGKTQFITKPIRDALLRLRKSICDAGEPDMNEWLPFYRHATGDEPKTAHDISEKALERIDSELEGIDSREASLIQYGSKIFAATGGMSHGDSPTRLFDDICDLQEMPDKLIKKAGLYF
jgi:hypothetical protein